MWPLLGASPIQNVSSSGPTPASPSHASTSPKPYAPSSRLLIRGRHHEVRTYGPCPPRWPSSSIIPWTGPGETDSGRQITHSSSTTWTTPSRPYHAPRWLVLLPLVIPPLPRPDGLGNKGSKMERRVRSAPLASSSRVDTCLSSKMVTLLSPSRPSYASPSLRFGSRRGVLGRKTVRSAPSTLGGPDCTTLLPVVYGSGSSTLLDRLVQRLPLALTGSREGETWITN